MFFQGIDCAAAKGGRWDHGAGIWTGAAGASPENPLSVKAPDARRLTSCISHDDKFLHCAVAAGADFIVSGDRHLLQLAKYRRIPIVSPSGLLQKISD